MYKKGVYTFKDLLKENIDKKYKQQIEYELNDLPDYIDKPDISDGLQIVVWQMAANSYSCILLPRNEEIYMNYLIGGTGYEAYKKKIIASGNPDAILEEINKLENMQDTAAADQKYIITDENIVVRVAGNPISSYINPIAGTDAYLTEVGEQFDNRFKVERGVIVYFYD